jgi:hypothetical protein
MPLDRVPRLLAEEMREQADQALPMGRRELGEETVFEETVFNEQGAQQRARPERTGMV